jgi:chromosome segregation ATPase
LDETNVTDEDCQSILERFNHQISEFETLKQTEVTQFNENISESESAKSDLQNTRATLEAELKVKKNRINEIKSEESEYQSIIDNASQNSERFNRFKKQERALNKAYEEVDWDEEGNKIDENVEKVKSQYEKFNISIEKLEKGEEAAKT